MFGRTPEITYDGVTRVGDREKNEDSILTRRRGGDYLFVVADGLGGHGYGDVASQGLIQAFESEFETADNNASFLVSAFERAQREILASQRDKSATGQMKTTAVALCVIGGKCAWGHIGDSRLYHFRRGVLRTRTIDHSVPQKLALAGVIKDEEIASHPDRARLLCAVGDRWDKPQYEISKEIPLRRGDAFLLCSDGFWEFMPETASGFAQEGDAAQWLSAMLAEVEDRGSDMDNYSAVSVVVK